MRPVDLILIGLLLYVICHVEQVRDGPKAQVGLLRLLAVAAGLGGYVWLLLTWFPA